MSMAPLITTIPNYLAGELWNSLPLARQDSRTHNLPIDIVNIVGILPCFQEEMMLQEVPIELEKTTA